MCIATAAAEAVCVRLSRFGVGSSSIVVARAGLSPSFATASFAAGSSAPRLASPLLVGCRSVHVMRSSWPRTSSVSDPNKPNIAKIIREMESNKTEGAAPTGRADARSGPQDRSRHNPNLPDGVLPSAAGPAAPTGGLAVAPALSPAAPRGPSPRGGPGADMGRGGSGAAGQWHPPGWEDFAKQRGMGGSKPRSRTRKERLGSEERPVAEVWGARIVVVLVLGCIWVEVKDITWGPQGITRTKGPQNKIMEE
mmetsp:Transcript_6795/g.17064  ORF Transcript_6795/g.17064 Transcript_6795/m.17064 type:complete len:252 (+) Transcript_6795:86-841(+)